MVDSSNEIDRVLGPFFNKCPIWNESILNAVSMGLRFFINNVSLILMEIDAVFLVALL